jgi:GAF domain-containing protein
MDKGIAGYVATEKRDLNIRDAYQDDRFNAENDVKTGYRTKTILAMPIVNEMGEVEGVIQAINKLPSENNMARYFTKDDEGLLQMLCNIGGVTLKNTQINSEQIQFHNNLRCVLTTGIALSR